MDSVDSCRRSPILGEIGTLSEPEHDVEAEVKQNSEQCLEQVSEKSSEQSDNQLSAPEAGVRKRKMDEIADSQDESSEDDFEWIGDD